MVGLLKRLFSYNKKATLIVQKTSQRAMMHFIGVGFIGTSPFVNEKNGYPVDGETWMAVRKDMEIWAIGDLKVVIDE